MIKILLRVKNVTVKYGEITALQNLNIDVKEGEITTLIGANGAGKTTLLKTVSGLLKPSEGEIQFNNQKISNLSPDKIVSGGIAQCPEGRKVFPRQTVYENLKAGAFVRSRHGVEEDIENYFNRFPRLRERRNQKAGSLSGGEQQMLAICRALMSRPKLLLLDEPSMGLAPIVVEEVFNIIKSVHESGTTILLVEQNARQALKIANVGYILEVGQVKAHGLAKDLLNSREVQDAYLGGRT